MLDEGHNDPRIALVDGDADATQVAGARQAPGELRPGGAAVRGLEQAAARTASPVAERGATTLVGAGVERVGTFRIHGDVDHAGVFIEKFHIGPGLAAVGRLVDATLLVGPVEPPEGCHVCDIRVRGMNHDASDVLRLLEAHVLERPSCVRALVDAAAPGRRLPVVGLARAHIQDRRVGGGEGQVADRGIVLVGEDGLEGRAAVRGLENARRSHPHVERQRIRFHHREVIHTASHVGGTDVAKLHCFEVIGGQGREGRGGGRRHGLRGLLLSAREGGGEQERQSRDACMSGKIHWGLQMGEGGAARATIGVAGRGFWCGSARASNANDSAGAHAANGPAAWTPMIPEKIGRYTVIERLGIRANRCFSMAPYL